MTTKHSQCGLCYCNISNWNPAFCTNKDCKLYRVAPKVVCIAHDEDMVQVLNETSFLGTYTCKFACRVYLDKKDLHSVSNYHFNVDFETIAKKPTAWQLYHKYDTVKVWSMINWKLLYTIKDVSPITLTEYNKDLFKRHEITHQKYMKLQVWA